MNISARKPLKFPQFRKRTKTDIEKLIKQREVFSKCRMITMLDFRDGGKQAQRKIHSYFSRRFHTRIAWIRGSQWWGNIFIGIVPVVFAAPYLAVRPCQNSPGVTIHLETEPESAMRPQLSLDINRCNRCGDRHLRDMVSSPPERVVTVHERTYVWLYNCKLILTTWNFIWDVQKADKYVTIRRKYRCKKTRSAGCRSYFASNSPSSDRAFINPSIFFRSLNFYLREANLPVNVNLK